MKIKILLIGVLACICWCFSTDVNAQTVLPLNGNATGSISASDDTTLYSLTTNADGEINLTLTVSNNTATYAALYDSDGVTLLVRNYTYTGPLVVSMDGLAQGKYFVKIYPYYNGSTPSFTIANTLTVPAQANDQEPNNSRAQAEVLTLNDSTKGHVGYYYNIHRDTADWYKVTTNADGLLRLRLKVANNTPVWCTLYDNDGTIILANNYTYTNIDINTDGLAAGTYYLKLTCFYNGQFAPYTLADSLFTYNANDTAPNSYPYQAITLPANGTVTGHVGFYYNNTKDTLDFWKINYTGSGNLNFTFNLIPHNVDGKISPVWFQVYNDTTKSPFYANYYSAASTNISFTDLSQGYYYIRIVPYYYNSDFNAYSVTNSFTQVNIAAISLLKSASHSSCSTDSLIYALSGSHAPYTVRLYRNGTVSDSLTTSSDSASFIGIKAGTYSATVYGDGATDAAFGTVGSVELLPPVPTGLNATNIMSHTATLNWLMLPCTDYDTVEYRASDTATWKVLTTGDNSGIYNLSNLAGNVDYIFRVASVVDVNYVAGRINSSSIYKPVLSSGYSSTYTFRTLIDLPVTLVNFSATANNSLVTLNWSTATEVNNKGFEIFRSVDGTNFTSIGFVAGAGTSNLLLNYQFTDKPGLNGKVFYRLKQTDLDGKFVWSNVVSVTLNGYGLITFMPNPAKSFITISSPTIVKQIRLFSVSGQIIKVWQNVSPNAQLDLGSIGSGTYLIEFINDQSSQTMKLLKSY